MAITAANLEAGTMRMVLLPQIHKKHRSGNYQ
jgi:hypothetical protein